jgi:hypothetical protein
VFGLNVHRLEADGKRAIAVEVPASIGGPHLIYRNDYFGAPIRNDSDTVWMKERQIEAMYRARFEERRHASEALDALFSAEAHVSAILPHFRQSPTPLPLPSTMPKGHIGFATCTPSPFMRAISPPRHISWPPPSVFMRSRAE